MLLSPAAWASNLKSFRYGFRQMSRHLLTFLRLLLTAHRASRSDSYFHDIHQQLQTPGYIKITHMLLTTALKLGPMKGHMEIYEESPNYTDCFKFVKVFIIMWQGIIGSLCKLSLVSDVRRPTKFENHYIITRICLISILYLWMYDPSAGSRCVFSLILPVIYCASLFTRIFH